MTRKILAFFLVLALGLTGCYSNNVDLNSEQDTSSSQVEFASNDEEMFTDRDLDASYDESTCVKISLEGDHIESSSDSVQISQSTITLTQAGTYYFSGTLNDGMIIVDAPDMDKLQLVFSNVNIINETTAPLYILEADKVFLTLADGSTNSLSNTGSFTSSDDNNIDGTIFSKQDLTINGTGTLNIISTSAHGIVCKDDLVITGGVISIESASHGIDANDSVRVTGIASINIDSGKDGIHVENTDDTTLGFIYISEGSFLMNAQGDGLSASAFIQIVDGSFEITAGGGYENGEQDASTTWGTFGEPGKNSDMKKAPMDRESGMLTQTSTTITSQDTSTSMKGIKADSDLLICAGVFVLDTADDGLHANADMYIEGGTFKIDSGDDAMHADKKMTISDGDIQITNSYEGIEALNIIISGGTIDLAASDDGVNAAGGTDSSGTMSGRDGRFGGNPISSSSSGTIQITGGTIQIQASGDGIDANGSIEMTGGMVYVCNPVRGDTSILDYDTTATITGGTFVGTGAINMAQSFSSSSQGVIFTRVSSQTTGTVVALYDENGNELLTSTPESDFELVILSSPAIISGQTYVLQVGSESNSVVVD